MASNDAFEAVLDFDHDEDPEELQIGARHPPAGRPEMDVHAQTAGALLDGAPVRLLGGGRRADDDQRHAGQAPANLDQHVYQELQLLIGKDSAARADHEFWIGSRRKLWRPPAGRRQVGHAVGNDLELFRTKLADGGSAARVLGDEAVEAAEIGGAVSQPVLEPGRALDILEQPGTALVAGPRRAARIFAKKLTSRERRHSRRRACAPEAAPDREDVLDPVQVGRVATEQERRNPGGVQRGRGKPDDSPRGARRAAGSTNAAGASGV